MNPALLAVCVALAGGVGAVGRYLLDATIQRRLRRRMPFGTLSVNVLGSFVLGLVVGLVAHHGVAPNLKTVLGVGFCGGFTTFSTASFETVQLLRSRLVAQSVAVALGGVVASLLAASAGLALALL